MHRAAYRNHLVKLSIISLVNMLLLLAVVVWQMQNTVYNERKRMVQSQVESAVNLANYKYQQALHGEITQAEAREQLVRTLKALRYQKNGYFWVLNQQGKVIMHPNSKWETTLSVIDLKDQNGRFFVRDIIKASELGGFVSYNWGSSETNQMPDRGGYAKAFAPWQLVIVSSANLDDLNAAVLDHFTFSFFSLVVLFLAGMYVSLRMSKKYLKAFRYKAVSDGLTKLYSRDYMDEMGDQFFQSSANGDFSIVFLDIDFFKDINDKYGHKYGDIVLEEVSTIIKSELLPHKEVFRYGGEEIVALLQVGEGEAVSLAEKVRLSVAAHNFEQINGHDVKITISAGIASKQADEDFSDVLKRADSCLYVAKARGRNTTVTGSNIRKSARD
ncbi:sensor domain-containing diguanylate cyclase [Marinomonas epiphytica]